MWPNSSGCNQWPGHTNQIGTPIWLTTHETVITPPRRLNLMYKGTSIDHGGRKSTIVSILNMRHPAALGNEVALRGRFSQFDLMLKVVAIVMRNCVINVLDNFSVFASGILFIYYSTREPFNAEIFAGIFRNCCILILIINSTHFKQILINYNLVSIR